MEKELEKLKQQTERIIFLCRFYRGQLYKIANYEENLEDYYGGVSHDWQKFAHDIMKLAQDSIK